MQVSMRSVFYALASAVLFGLSTPLAKIVLRQVPPIALAGFLYLGAFIGLSFFKAADKLGTLLFRRTPMKLGASLEKKDAPWLAGAILAGGVGGPILLMLGLERTSGFSASLLLNFEALATAFIAVLLFRENAGKTIWVSLGLLTLGGILLAWDPGRGRLDPLGPVLILTAMIFWGVDNNLTRHISEKDPIDIARIKGLAAGMVSLGMAILLEGDRILGMGWLFALSVGAVGYGLSLVLFILALRDLGAFRTGALFSTGPFVGALAALALLAERPTLRLAAAGACMGLGVLLTIFERHRHHHKHHVLYHTHAHVHDDLHHEHHHDPAVDGSHIHGHEHRETNHIHVHWPDTHLRHGHDGREGGANIPGPKKRPPRR